MKIPNDKLKLNMDYVNVKEENINFYGISIAICKECKFFFCHCNRPNCIMSCVINKVIKCSKHKEFLEFPNPFSEIIIKNNIYKCSKFEKKL